MNKYKTIFELGAISELINQVQSFLFDIKEAGEKNTNDIMKIVPLNVSLNKIKENANKLDSAINRIDEIIEEDFGGDDE